MPDFPYEMYVYGSLLWICIGCILFMSYIVLMVCSLITRLMPSTVFAPHPTKDISVQMTDIVSEYGFREENIDVSGVTIHCVMKDPTDPTDPTDDVFVFIHGTASSSIIFFDMMKHLPSNQKCVAIDLPNFGISGCVDIDRFNSCEEIGYCYADIIGNTLNQLGILKNAIVVAYSLGGFLSIYVADMYPIKKLVLMKPVGILPTLGEYGYYWGAGFKVGIPTSLFHLPGVSRDLIEFIGRKIFHQLSSESPARDKTTEFWLSSYMNERNTGHKILQRLITLRPFYSYWNTPVINRLLDVYKKVPTYMFFGEDDTIIPSHIGNFIHDLTDGEIMIYNIKNEAHNPWCNVDYFLKYSSVVRSETRVAPVVVADRKLLSREHNKLACRGYSYHSFDDTTDSFRALYSTLLVKHTTYCPQHSALPP